MCVCLLLLMLLFLVCCATSCGVYIQKREGKTLLGWVCGSFADERESEGVSVKRNGSTGVRNTSVVAFVAFLPTIYKRLGL